MKNIYALCTLLTLTAATAVPATGQEIAAVTWTGRVMRLDANTGAVISSTSLFPTLMEVNGAAWTLDGRWLVAADRGDRLVEVDPVTFQMGASYNAGGNIRGVAVHPISGEVYITGSGLFIFDLATETRTQIGGGSGTWQSLEFSDDGRLWAWNISPGANTNGLWELDPENGALLQHITDPSGTISDRHQFLAARRDGTFLTGNSELFSVDPTTGVETLILDTGFDIRGADLIEERIQGTTYCSPAVPNSSGRPARLTLSGSGAAADNRLWLGCTNLPLNSFGYFLTSDTTDFVANPAGSQGHLCLGGGIGRYTNAIVNSRQKGWVSINVDLTQVPTPLGPTNVLAGQTRHFSYWFRDANPTPTSNFADARTITLQ